MGSDYFLALLLLPGLVLFSRRRAVVVGVIVAMLATLATGHLTRFLLPLVWWVCWEASMDLERLPGLSGSLAGPVLAVGVLVQVVIDPWGMRPAWRLLVRPPAAQWEDFTTLAKSVGQLETLHPRRLFVVGDLRSDLLPGRILFDGAVGETPLVWRFAHESGTVDGIRRKFRQAGARWMLYNYVSVEWVSLRYRVFPWRDEALRRYVEYCKRYLRVRWRSEESDYVNGGFYIFEILPRPLARPPATVWFAPGTEGLYGEGILLHNAGRTMDSLHHYLSVLQRLPDVGTSWNLVGHEYAVLNDTENAYKYLSPFAQQGMMDSMNLGEYAAACVRTGRLEEGGRLLEEAKRRYPGHRIVVLVNQAAWCGRMAVKALGERKAQKVVAYLDQGDACLAQVPPQPEGPNEDARKSTQAYLLGLRGELYAILGRSTEATELLHRAVDLAPNSPIASRWRALLDAVAPRLF
jgi:tetratricopeptide (TPR) repeat protein